jgi:hypothetical protein
MMVHQIKEDDMKNTDITRMQEMAAHCAERSRWFSNYGKPMYEGDAAEAIRYQLMAADYASSARALMGI